MRTVSEAERRSRLNASAIDDHAKDMFAVAQQRSAIDRAESGLPVRSPQTVPDKPGSAAYEWPMNSATKEQSAQIGPTRRTRDSGARTNWVTDFGCRGVCGFASALSE